MSTLTNNEADTYAYVFGYLFASDDPAVYAELLAAAESSQARGYGPMPEWWAERFWTHNHLPAPADRPGDQVRAIH